MLHIVQHAKSKKFEVVSISKNGQFLEGSNQGYEKRAGCHKHIRSLMKECFQLPATVTILIQDDTTIEPGVWAYGYKTREFREDIKPTAKYVLNKKN